MAEESLKFTEDDEIDEASDSTILYETLARLCEQYPIDDVLEQLAAVCQEMGYVQEADLLNEALDYAFEDIEE